MLKNRLLLTFIFIILHFTVFNNALCEIFEQNNIFIDIPSNMTTVKSDFPMVIAQIKYKDKDFPTVTITNEQSKDTANLLPQELEARLKETYERLGFKVLTSNFLKTQAISTYTSNLFQIEYTYNGLLFVSLINIFTYNDQTHYITTINKIDNQTPLKETIKFQEGFLNFISLEKKTLTNDSKSSNETKNNSASNILIGCIALLGSAILFAGKKS